MSDGDRIRIHVDLKKVDIEPVIFRAQFYDAIRDITTKDVLMISFIKLIIELSTTPEGRYFISDLASGSIQITDLLGGKK